MNALHARNTGDGVAEHWTLTTSLHYSRHDGVAIEGRFPEVRCSGDAQTYALIIGPEAKTKAAMIAAAPELYDLAMKVATLSDSALGNANVLRSTLREYRQIARVLLAKAEGRAP